MRHIICHKKYPKKDDIAEMIDFLTEEGKCEISELEMNLLVLTLNQLKIRIQQIVSGTESPIRSNFRAHLFQNIANID